MTAPSSPSHVANELLAQVEEFVEALQNTAATERLSPDTLDAIYAIAYQQIQQNRIKPARNYLALLLVYAPTDPRFLSAMAHCCEKDGDDDEAIQLYSLALYIAPQSCQLALALAECLIRRDNVDAAIQILEQLVRIGTDDANERYRSRAELWLHVLALPNPADSHARSTVA